MTRPPVVVVGPGRCGSSTVARILHEQFGVCMAHEDRPADEYNRAGYFEDQRVRALIKLYAGNDMEADADLIDQLHAIHAGCTRWGIKAGLYKVRGAMWQIKPRHVIRCVRDEGAVASSWVRITPDSARIYGEDFCRRYWQRAVRRRNELIDREAYGMDVTEINFDRQRSDDYVRDRIVEVLR